MARGLVVNPDRCTSCHRCELWCSLTHEQVMNPMRARLHVVRREPSLDTPLVCLQCGVCMAGCPFDAMRRDVRTGAVVIDEEACKHCGICILSCPYGMLKYAPDSRVPVKCDLCSGDPECVKHCREGALTYGDVNSVAAQRREVYARSLTRRSAVGPPPGLLSDAEPDRTGEG